MERTKIKWPDTYMIGNIWKITLSKGGVSYPISRSVTDIHPQAVHDALGTSSESDLQYYLDQCHVSDWYSEDGQHLGPDSAGLVMSWADDLQDLVGQRVEAGEDEDHDVGRVIRILDRDTALIAWDSGVRTPANIGDLIVLEIY